MVHSDEKPIATTTGEPSTQTGPVEIGSPSTAPPVTRIADEHLRNEGAFRPVYDGEDDPVEVEILERVPAPNSEFDTGHILITRPEWTEPKKAQPGNVRVDVEADFEC